jgi:hypothetical protein
MGGIEMAFRKTIQVTLTLAVSTLPFTMSCSQHEPHASHAEHPSEVEKIEGSELSRVTLSAKAAERIDLKTAPVREQDLNGTPRKVVPYSSLLYDAKGRTWVYASPQPLSFVREAVAVDRIDGNSVYLEDGPPVGTEVASVGVAEIYGAETGVGH